MRRSIMAIDAVHPPPLGIRHLFGRSRPIPVAIFRNIALSVFDLNPGDGLAVIVRGNESDFICQVHVPVYPSDRSSGRITATHIY